MSKLNSPLWEWITKKLQRHEMKKKGLVQSKKKKRLTEEGVIGRAAEKSKIIGIFILFTVWCFCVAVLVLPPVFEPLSDVVYGQKAQNTIYSDFNFSYVDNNATEARKQEILKSVPLVYNLDYQICDECMETTKAMLKIILQYSGNTVDNKKILNSKLLNVYKTLSQAEQNALIVLLNNKESEKELLELLQTSLYHGIISKDERFRRDGMLIRINKDNKEKAKSFSSIATPEEVTKKIALQTSRSFSPDNRNILKSAVYKILSAVIKSNLIYSQKMTDIDKQKATVDIIPVKNNVKAGSIIVSKGKIIDDNARNRYDKYVKERKIKEGSRDFYRQLFVSAFLCMLLMCLSGIYIGHIHPEIVESNHKMALLGTVVIIGVITNYFAIEGFQHMRLVFNLHPQLLPSVVPIAMASIIISPLLGLRVAHYVGLFVSIIAAMQLDNSFPVMIQGMLLCGISGFVVRYKPNHRSYFLSAAVVVALGTPSLALVNLWAVNGDWNLISRIVSFGIVNGVATAILALVFLFLLEIIFQISSDMTLLLLCDYNHPLLKRLQLEAPGTYHHSLVVSTLTEHAAQAIGANPIRARVIALFHDIGKMVKPEYFTENQHNADSKHLKLNPRMSSLIIINHVKEGTDMALKHKLRKIIRDGIQQHHGTSLIFYFYNQAMEEARKKNAAVDENDFRYPGPLPKEKEVVILSLADAAEAASRSLQKPTPQKIDALIWEIFRKRIRNGQLDAANLTFGELKKIRESFVATLTTMLHGRIAYPKEQDDEDDDEGDLFVATAKIESSAKTKD